MFCNTLCAGRDEVTKPGDISNFYVVDEIKGVYRGMMIAIPPNKWVQFQAMPARQFCTLLVRIAEKIDWNAFKKSHRPPKKPKGELPSAKNKHVSTAKLLAAAKQKRLKEKVAASP